MPVMRQAEGFRGRRYPLIGVSNFIFHYPLSVWWKKVIDQQNGCGVRYLRIPV
jgi:hypothetical protein